MVAGGIKIRCIVRSLGNLHHLPRGIDLIPVADISRLNNWNIILSGIDTVVHLAAKAHRFKKEHLSDFYRINVEATEALARASAKAGVKRFIYISSVGVNGEFNSGMPLRENDVLRPHSAYAISKWQAENVLQKVLNEMGMEIVILRPPLVYGLGAPGNFGRLLRLVNLGIPLPLGNINNLRSFIYLGNLIDAIIVCIQHPRAAGEVFLVSDGQDISTPDLIRMIAQTMGKKPRLFTPPYSILKALCMVVGKSEELEKLTGTLVVDSSKIRNLLGWKPPFTLREGIRETVRGMNV